MADECSYISNIVTTFFVSTCRLPPRLSGNDVQAAMYCACLSTRPPDKKIEDFIPLITGSAAEFYIEPMLPHLGDIDVMLHRNTELAIPEGHPPPTQLPAEFNDYVQVVEIKQSKNLPGYAYLPYRYTLTEYADVYKYSTIDKDEGMYLLRSADYKGDVRNIHGPAIFSEHSHPSNLSTDFVFCVRCLSWPSQASDWPTRHRNYGWPDSATVDRVVSNGCDLVYVAHRQCRQHEWMGRYQWRLSFSRAEIVLINSWMPVQQIVYHMLRYFLKTERLTDCFDNSGALSNYHIKTLMLWACELKPRSWWTENLNLVRICVELMQTLSVWLTDTRCPHYFVSNCNLLDNSFHVKNAASILNSLDEAYLSTWFIHNYIGKCAQLCPNYVTQLFDDVSTSLKLEKAVLGVVLWRRGNVLHDDWSAVKFGEKSITANVSKLSITARSCLYWMKELTKVDRIFADYFTAVALLHVACKMSRNDFNNKLMDVIETLLGSNLNQLPLCKTELSTSELVEFLQKSAVQHLTTFRQLVARDFGSVVTIVTTDFEALYAYKRGDYQRCLQLSTQNVHTLLYATDMTDIPILPEFIQLLDDDIVSLTALTLIIDPKCREDCNPNVWCITQLTLSLCLMTQCHCQLKLRYSVTSLAQTLYYIKVAQRRNDYTLDQLILKLIERKSTRTT